MLQGDVGAFLNCIFEATEDVPFPICSPTTKVPKKDFWRSLVLGVIVLLIATLNAALEHIYWRLRQACWGPDTACILLKGFVRA